MRIVFVDNIQPPKQNKFHRNFTCPTWTCWILLTRWSLRIPGVVSVPFWRFLNITSKWQCFRPCLPNWLSCQRRNDCRFVENQFFIFTCLSDMLSPFFSTTNSNRDQTGFTCLFLSGSVAPKTSRTTSQDGRGHKNSVWWFSQHVPVEIVTSQSD